MLSMAAFSALVTTFQPKTWPKYIRNCICQTNLGLFFSSFIDLFEHLEDHFPLGQIKIFGPHLVLFYSKNF